MSKFRGKKVLIVGFGQSGVAVARYMAKQGARIMVTDLKPKNELAESFKAAGDIKLESELGTHSSKTFLGAELIIVSPGVPMNLKPLEEARERNIPMMSEVDLAASVIREPMIAVAGTYGKTTVSNLIAEMLRAEGKTVFLGGGAGAPLLDYVTDEHKSDYVIVELSSFQLEQMEKLAPQVAVFTNVGSEFLDRYVTMEAYLETQKRLLQVCDRSTSLVLNYDDPYVNKFAESAPGKVFWFTKANPLQVGGDFAENFQGCYLSATDALVIGKYGSRTGADERYPISAVRLFGDHNRENVMAAINAARALGVTTPAIQKALDGFKGVAHRLEYIRKKDGVYIFNDSKSCTPSGIQRSLLAFKRSPVILIAGGKDTSIEYGDIAGLVEQRCKILILVGEAKEKLNRVLGDYVETYLLGTLEEAVLLAFQKSRTGDIILLSPGCPSHDLFRSFEERGDYYRKLVSQL